MIREEFGPAVEVHPRSFLLRPEADPNATFTSYRDMHWRNAQSQEEAGPFEIPEVGMPFPSGSFPGQIAAKAALRQGRELFERFHAALFKAMFVEHRHITESAVLAQIASEVGVDIEKFRADVQSEQCRQEVIDDYSEAVNRYGITGIPTVVVDEKEVIVGAVPREVYREVIKRRLEERA